MALVQHSLIVDLETGFDPANRFFICEKLKLVAEASRAAHDYPIQFQPLSDFRDVYLRHCLTPTLRPGDIMVMDDWLHP